MKLEDELKMQHFTDNYQRAYLSIVFTGNWLEDQVQQQLKQFGISTSQFNVLRILRGQKGKPMSAFAIQERMIHRSSNVTRIIEKLVEKTLVTRTHSATNRRMVDVALTQEGLAVINSTDSITVGFFEKMSKVISDQEAQKLGDWMDEIRGNL